MNSAGTEPGQTIDERLSYSYTDDEVEKIGAAVNRGILPLDAAIHEARDALYRDIIIKAAVFADQYAAESADKVVYIGVTHSPTIEGIEYIVTGDKMLKNEPEYMQGFTLKDNLFIPDKAEDKAISYDSLVEVCLSGWKLIS